MRKRTLIGAFLCFVTLLGCGGPPPAPPPNPAEVSARTLKEKFAAQHNCAVYELIDTLQCAGDVVQTTCQDTAGQTQVDFFIKNPVQQGAWISEKDVDEQINAATASLADGRAKKMVFATAQGASGMCKPN